VNVGGLWRTSVELKEEATWYDLKYKIEKVTGIWMTCQKLEPDGKDGKKCELEEGDDVFCDWKFYDGDHPLHYAAKDGNIEAIRLWVASGADMNVVNEYKLTPLMYVCYRLTEECVTELLKWGSNTNLIDNDGETALHKITLNYSNLEKIEKMEKIAKMLIKAGCDLTTRNENGETFIDKLKRRDCNELATKIEEWIKDQT